MGCPKAYHSLSDLKPPLLYQKSQDLQFCRGLKPVPQPLRTELSHGVALDLISHDFHVCEPLLI